MTKTTTTTDLVDFAVRTTDRAWIARNHGRDAGNGLTVVQVPAAEVEAVAIGKGMLRHRFADKPKDSERVILCRAAYVPQTAARYEFTRETGIPAQVAEFMRQQAGR